MGERTPINENDWTEDNVVEVVEVEAEELASLRAMKERADAVLASERAYDPDGDVLERVEFILRGDDG
jgi:hypothetical protein